MHAYQYQYSCKPTRITWYIICCIYLCKPTRIYAVYHILHNLCKPTRILQYMICCIYLCKPTRIYGVYHILQYLCKPTRILQYMICCIYLCKPTRIYAVYHILQYLCKPTRIYAAYHMLHNSRGLNNLCRILVYQYTRGLHKICSIWTSRISARLICCIIMQHITSRISVSIDMLHNYAVYEPHEYWWGHILHNYAAYQPTRILVRLICYIIMFSIWITNIRVGWYAA